MRLLQVIVPVLVFASVYFGIHYWFWDNLVQEPQWSSVVTALLTCLLMLLASFIPLAMPARVFLGGKMRRFFMYLSYSWLGIMGFLGFQMLLIEVIQLVYSMFVGPGPEDIVWLSRLLATIVMGATAIFTLVGLYQGNGPTPIKRISIPILNLASSLSGLRIVQLTDIHIGPTNGPAFIRELVEKTNAERPDIIVITGDLVDGRVGDLGDDLSELRNLEAKHGVFFITGNHEYYSGVDEWIRFLPGLGIQVLMNQRVSIEHEGERLEVAGVPDLTGHRIGPPHKPDLQKTLEGRDKNIPLILLAHQPRQFTEAAEHGVTLQLSGHTHGGQFFPFNLIVKAVEPYFRGLYRVKESTLYVSRGTGYWGPPLRFLVPRELTVIELTQAS